MLKEERQQYIINQINIHNKVLSTDLSAQLNVSEDTIRRDLNELAELGKIVKVYGGALSKSFHYPFSGKEVYNKDGKKEIARKAAKLIEDGMVLLIGGGTTMIELARIFPENLHCTIFTISPLVALELVEHPNMSVNLLAGQLGGNSHIVTGSQVISQLSEIKADLCFLGTNGISLTHGITDSDWEVVQVKKAMIKSASKTAILSISEKLDSVQKMQICNLNNINCLITDADESHENVKRYAKKITVL
ncbi:DeoR/GlpR family DNA-binding transcription regulator [Mucilaginibacter sp. RS28]|uniref:DeoR/GlpR family DNA-binding transcription regulator n=1 Tax=Mucilaginibacter straminoryzae TaxID=2932774 RepID=A0A9X1X392_9SPHI|nr:DeoR/GlpR family DNA-binding transcription regulator [Mucilaginibacter straminoryzae]MCJ8209245.1 DeoR/GlpR family DNA-binding transcription regulator [Mucilaginibacter straminoryzae]